MTITYLGLGTTQSANNTQGVRSYVVTGRFSTTSSSESAFDVGSHASVPVIGSAHPDDPYAFVKSLDVDLTEPKFGWTVTAHYTTERELATDPTNEPAIITVSTEQFQKVADRDKNGYAICNSAGDPFDPPYMMDDSRRVITVSKNMSGHPSWILSYADVVNNDAFSVKGQFYAIGQGKVQRVSIGEEQVRNGVSFVVVSFDIHLQRDGWILKPLDAGFRKKIGTTRGKIYNDGDGSQPTSPVCLDGSGGFLVNPTTLNAVYGSYTIYNTLPFSALPLT